MLTIHLDKFPVLETGRLILREHQLSDAPRLFSMRHNDQVMHYLDRPRPADLQEVEQLIGTIKEKFWTSENFPWVITLKDAPDEFIGSIAYWRMDLPNHRGEVGYILHPDHWGKGIASEALTAVLKFGFEEMKLHSVSANINPHNAASRALLLKHGFIKEAYFREDYYYDGKFLDTEIYSKLGK